MRGGKVLPYDALCDYISSDGIAACNTNILTTNEMEEIRFKAIHTVKTSGNQRVFGYENDGWHRMLFRWEYGGLYDVRGFFGTKTFSETKFSEVADIVFDLKNKTMKVNNSIVSCPDFLVGGDYPIGVCCIMYSGINTIPTSKNFVGKFYGFIIKYAGDIIRSIKPAVKNGIGCLYDSMTGELMFSHTSSQFGFGND